jgi:hypothetical protein
MIRNALRVVLAVVVGAPLVGCLSAKSYVDPALPAVEKHDLTAAKDRAPVQLLFEFQTKGEPNGAVTKAMTPRVLEVAKASELFSEVSADSVSNGRKLLITINNVADTDSAVGKGIGAGATLGLAGTMVTDRYVCDAQLLAPGKPPVRFSYRHAIHTTIGNKEGPPNLVAYRTQEAAHIVIDQLVWSALRDISKSGSL